jgi:hypothetical protein
LAPNISTKEQPEMTDQNSSFGGGTSFSRRSGSGAARRQTAIAVGLAGAVAAGAGLFLWSRGRPAVAGEESLAEEVQAHPS